MFLSFVEIHLQEYLPTNVFSLCIEQGIPVPRQEVWQPLMCRLLVKTQTTMHSMPPFNNLWCADLKRDILHAITSLSPSSALGYIVGSEVSALVHKFFNQSDSWRWALRVRCARGIHKLCFSKVSSDLISACLISLHTCTLVAYVEGHDTCQKGI